MNDNVRNNSANMEPSRMELGLVAVIVYDGLSLFEYGCAVEVFGLPRPEMGEHWYRFASCAAEPGVLRGAGGIQLQPADGLELLEQARTIIVPGWRGIEAPVPEPLCEALRQAHARGARILSICTGAFVLAAAGLLDGRRALRTGAMPPRWRFVIRGCKCRQTCCTSMPAPSSHRPEALPASTCACT